MPWISVNTATCSPSLIKPMAMPPTGFLIGTPASIKREGAAADAGHRGAAVGAHHFADEAQHVGKLFFRRDHRQERLFRQGAVADFAPARTAHGIGLAGAVGREVVVMHIALVVFRAQAHP